LEDKTKFFMDIWQSQMHQKQKVFLANSFYGSENFSFYREGHDMWKASYDF